MEIKIGIDVHGVAIFCEPVQDPEFSADEMATVILIRNSVFAEQSEVWAQDA